MQPYTLDDTIIKLKSDAQPWTFRHAFEGVQIFGGIGSGKSSGSGATLAIKFLEKGFGGLVLTVKHDEVNTWLDYAKRTNRLNDIIVIEPNGDYKFNFLEYESRSSDTNKSITDNIVDVLKTVIKASQDKETGKGDDSFWENAIDMLMYNLIDLCKLAYGHITVTELFEVAQSLPKPATKKVENAPDNAFEKAYKLAHANVKRSFMNGIRL